MKKIKLSQEQFALVNDEDFERLNAFKWHATWDPNSKTYYAQRMSSRVNGKQHTILMHREIMGAKPNDQVDHIDHNGLDNQRKSLRLCTRSQNKANQRMRVDNTSGFKGVSWYKRHGKWRARIMVKRKALHLGLFINKIDAALAYDRAAIKELGPYAKTNQSLSLIPLDRQVPA